MINNYLINIILFQRRKKISASDYESIKIKKRINFKVSNNKKLKVHFPIFSNFQLLATKSKIDKLMYEKSYKLSEMGKSNYIPQTKCISINFQQIIKPILIPREKKNISLNTNKLHLIALTKDEFNIFRQKYYKDIKI